MAFRRQRLLCCVFGLLVAIVTGFVYVAHRTTPTTLETSTPPVGHTVSLKTPQDITDSFSEALQARFPRNSTVILALVDTSFVDMALNFYITSLQRHHIENFLFVGATRQACLHLSLRHLPCVIYTNIDTGDKPSLFGSRDFIRKMNIRTEMILDALFLGYTVLHTDLDVVFLRNPLRHLAATRSDLAALWDSSVYNAGFLLVRPSTSALWIYQRVRQITVASDTTDDQTALNIAIKECSTHEHPCQTIALPVDLFACGLQYFETGARMFAGQNPCMECVVVHNNWIVSKEAKVYRFKEHLMWWNDEEAYYSSSKRRYLSYTHAAHGGLEQDTEALAHALTLGHLLNRTVILPRFHCPDRPEDICPLNSLYNIQAFDSQFFGAYRENSFLLHPLVPNSVANSRATVQVGNIPVHNSNNRSVISLNTRYKKVLDRLMGEKAHVLDVGSNMHSKYLKRLFTISNIDLALFKSKFSRGLERSNYRQYRGME